MLTNVRRHFLLGSALFVASSALVLGCAAAHADDATASESSIVGGAEAQPGAWAGTVALYYQGYQVCGGTLIADDWVLTAGHCMVSPSAVNGGIDNVVIGRHALSATNVGETIPVQKYYRHERWTSNLDNDIALLHLAHGSSLAKVKLLSSEQAAAIVPNATVTVVGWGNTAETAAQTSDVLREVSVPVIDQAQCSTWYSSMGATVTQNMICAGLPEGTKDSCQGDSGGPLFMKVGADVVQVGIVSWGYGCARPKAPGIYTRLGNYLDWVSRTTGLTFGGSTHDAGAPQDAGATTVDAGADASTSDAGTTDAGVSHDGGASHDGGVRGTHHHLNF